MTVDIFLDSNIIVYAVDTSPDEAVKRARSRELLREDRFGTSAQVVQEFYNVTTRKLAKPLPPTLAARWVDRLLRMPFVVTDAVLIKTALVRSHAYRIAYRDAAILSAAEALGAKTVYSEDLNHGQLYGSVRVVNPFK